MRTQRVNEMMATMRSFSKDRYQKNELLTEMFALQKEIVELTFNGKHASIADLKIWDVEKHLERLNRECGNMADEELRRFQEESKIFSNLIKAEVSGNRGEAKAFRILQNVRSENIILKNVELSDGDCSTELDVIVITPGFITIVEVKNTAKDIFIDENGGYYRTGKYLCWDCNIADKMTLKEDLLRKVLADSGIKNISIKSIVVFTNNRIEVQNQYLGIKTCFASQLACIIDGFTVDTNMTREEMEHVEKRIKEARSEKAYPLDFDVAQYKLDFATVMAILEEASAQEEKIEHNKEIITEPKLGVWDNLKKFYTFKYIGYAESVAMVAAVTFISTVAVSAIRKGGLR